MGYGADEDDDGGDGDGQQKLHGQDGVDLPDEGPTQLRALQHCGIQRRWHPPGGFHIAGLPARRPHLPHLLPPTETSDEATISLGVPTLLPPPPCSFLFLLAPPSSLLVPPSFLLSPSSSFLLFACSCGRKHQKRWATRQASPFRTFWMPPPTATWTHVGAAATVQTCLEDTCERTIVPSRGSKVYDVQRNNVSCALSDES